MKRRSLLVLMLLLSILLFTAVSCYSGNEISSGEKQSASNDTKGNNERVYDMLNFSDKAEVILAQQGCVDKPEAIEIKDDEGNTVYSQRGYGFIDDLKASPDEVNPSLWNNSQLNSYYGLFAIEEDFLYQVRGYDVTNLTIISIDEGYIVINPMSNKECTRAAMELVYKDIGKKPVLTVILTSPLVDNWGGIVALKELNHEMGETGFDVLATTDFEEKALSQNNLLLSDEGLRFSEYENGYCLEKSETGALSTGDGLSKYSSGTISYLSPTRTIDKEEELKIGKAELILSPVEVGDMYLMNVYIENNHTLYLAENTQTAVDKSFYQSDTTGVSLKEYASFLLNSIERFNDTEILIQPHNWSHDGEEGVREYVKNTAKAYKYIHDKTVCYINKGLSRDEIAKNIKLPENFALEWYLRQYRMSVEECVKGVYDSYVKDYCADFTKISELSDTKKAEKFVEYMGGDTESILKKAKEDYDKGEYAWVCEITKVLMDYDKENTDAKNLCADSLEQLAYMSESGTSRNLYLSYAESLRGNITLTGGSITDDESVRHAMSTEQILDIFSVRINSDSAERESFHINIYVEDEDKNYVLELENGVLFYRQGKRYEDANASIQLSKDELFSFIDKDYSLQDGIEVIGDENIIKVLNSLIA